MQSSKCNTLIGPFTKISHTTYTSSLKIHQTFEQNQKINSSTRIKLNCFPLLAILYGLSLCFTIRPV